MKGNNMSYTDLPIQKMTFAENDVSGTLNDDIRSLKEWMIVEAIAGLEVADGEDENTFDKFCELEGIQSSDIREHPIEFGLTINGHKIKHGNQMLQVIFGLYNEHYEKLKDIDHLDTVKEFVCVLDILNMAKDMCHLAERLETAVNDASSKDVYKGDIAIQKDLIDEFKERIESN